MQNNNDIPLISWACYEPAGHRVEICESTLLQHVLVIGSTGCGKSSQLVDATRQLIEKPDATGQIGLLILDAKEELVGQIRDSVVRAGRQDDLLLFGPGGTHGLELFGDLHSLEDVDRITRRMLLGSEMLGGDNAYWWHATKSMISAALTLIVESHTPVTFGSIVEFMRRWFLSPTTPTSVTDIVRRIDSCNRHPLLEIALDQIELWEHLDPRTRSNLQSCLLTAIRPLLSPAATRCFGRGRGQTFSSARAATSGAICVVSVNAMREPDLAQFAFRLAKESFFEAVQARSAEPYRLCGLIADELPLVVSPEDAEQLATVRSRRCFVLAATQDLGALKEKLRRGCGSILHNFNTIIYMRTREAETSEQAFVSLGSRRPSSPRRVATDPDAELLDLLEPSADNGGPVCPLGELGRLSPHQAFLIFADGTVTDFPVWFMPWFVGAQQGNPAPATPPEDKFKPSHVLELMLAAGFKQRHDPAFAIRAAILTGAERDSTLRRVTSFFRSECCMVPEGLETLPAAWLAALPGILWSKAKPHWTHLPYFMDRIALVDGLILLGFAQEQASKAGEVSRWDELRIAVNAGIYPSIWRPLSRRHSAELGTSTYGASHAMRASVESEDAEDSRGME